MVTTRPRRKDKTEGNGRVRKKETAKQIESPNSDAKDNWRSSFLPRAKEGRKRFYSMRKRERMNRIKNFYGPLLQGKGEV